MFSSCFIRRPSPAAVNVRPIDQNRWPKDAIKYDKRNQKWIRAESVKDDWQLRHIGKYFKLKLTPAGHLGVFTEQAFNWSWIDQLPISLTGRKAINLFAYTGGTTLALAKRGAEVVHLDAAKNVVAWARENATLSQFQNKKIRWIVDDANKFVEREIKRRNRYDFIVLDPPAVGHFGNRMTWNFHRDIEPLFQRLSCLASEQFCGLIATCHTEGCDQGQLRHLADKHFDIKHGSRESGSMDLTCKQGRKLNCGYYFRWHS